MAGGRRPARPGPARPCGRCPRVGEAARPARPGIGSQPRGQGRRERHRPRACGIRPSPSSTSLANTASPPIPSASTWFITMTRPVPPSARPVTTWPTTTAGTGAAAARAPPPPHPAAPAGHRPPGRAPRRTWWPRSKRHLNAGSSAQNGRPHPGGTRYSRCRSRGTATIRSPSSRRACSTLNPGPVPSTSTAPTCIGAGPTSAASEVGYADSFAACLESRGLHRGRRLRDHGQQIQRRPATARGTEPERDHRGSRPVRWPAVNQPTAIVNHSGVGPAAIGEPCHAAGHLARARRQRASRRRRAGAPQPPGLLARAGRRHLRPDHTASRLRPAEGSRPSPRTASTDRRQRPR